MHAIPIEEGALPRGLLHRAAALMAVAFSLTAFSAACSGSREQTSPDEGIDSAAEEPERRQGVPDSEPGDRIVSFDVDGDDDPNVWHHYRSLEDGEEQLVRKDVDLNGNGRIDVWRFYDEEEQLEKEAFDLDFDGIVDVWSFYDEEGNLVRKEADLSLNGSMDVWKYYEDGRLVRKERDTNGDGRADYFEFWEEGEIDRIGEDLTGDGMVDRWTRRAQR